MEHADGRVLGTVRSVQNFGAGDLIEVQPETGAPYFLPFDEDTFPEIDAAAGRLVASPDDALLPEGLSRPEPESIRTDPEP